MKEGTNSSGLSYYIRAARLTKLQELMTKLTTDSSSLFSLIERTTEKMNGSNQEKTAIDTSMNTLIEDFKDNQRKKTRYNDDQQNDRDNNGS